VQAVRFLVWLVGTWGTVAESGNSPPEVVVSAAVSVSYWGWWLAKFGMFRTVADCYGLLRAT